MLIFHYLPSETQAERHCYRERMLSAVGFKTTAVSEIIEHVGFQVQTERIEYIVLHTNT